jgi:hypothetical protein
MSWIDRLLGYDKLAAENDELRLENQTLKSANKKLSEDLSTLLTGIQKVAESKTSESTHGESKSPLPFRTMGRSTANFLRDVEKQAAAMPEAEVRKRMAKAQMYAGDV